jgi:hypothetical protein
MKGWYGDNWRHSLAAKGIRTSFSAAVAAAAIPLATAYMQQKGDKKQFKRSRSLERLRHSDAMAELARQKQIAEVQNRVEERPMFGNLFNFRDEEGRLSFEGEDPIQSEQEEELAKYGFVKKRNSFYHDPSLGGLLNMRRELEEKLRRVEGDLDYYDFGEHLEKNMALEKTLKKEIDEIDDLIAERSWNKLMDKKVSVGDLA